jgi:redox-sensing transcriptional repressor
MASEDENGKHPTAGQDSRMSRASVGRFSLYLRRLEDVLIEGHKRVSSHSLGESLGISDTQIRKDLASLGSLGQPGIGYDVAELIGAIRSTLGIDRTWNAILVGVGNLARALLRYQGFVERGFRIVALFDADPEKVGTTLEGLPIYPPERMKEVIEATGAELGILTVPAHSVQNVADGMIAAGIRGLLNFAPGIVRVPEGVRVVGVDLTVQLEQLAFLVHLGDDARISTR